MPFHKNDSISLKDPASAKIKKDCHSSRLTADITKLMNCNQHVKIQLVTKFEKKNLNLLATGYSQTSTNDHLSTTATFLVESPNIACKNIRFSSLFAAGDVSHRGMSATQRQKFHTDDIKSVRNLVRRADWSTE